MNSDPEDLNNHAPEVSPGNGWAEAEPESEIPKFRLPPKKKSKRAFVRSDEPISIAPRTMETVSDSENEDELESGIALEGLAGKMNEVPVVETAMAVSHELSKTDEESGSVDLNDQATLPPAPKVKRSRLNFNIGPVEATEPDPKPDFRPIQKIPDSPVDSSEDNSDEDAVRLRRRYIGGERHDWGEERARDSGKWIIYTGAGVVLLVILAVTLSQMFGTKLSDKSDNLSFNQLSLAKEEPVNEAESPDPFEILNAGEQEAKNMYGKYASAITSAEFSGLLYKADEVLLLVEKNWKSSGLKPGWISGQVAEWTVLDSKGKLFGVLKGTHPDFTDFNAFFRIQEHRMTIDWKATAAYSTATFAEMKTGAGDGSEIRTWISPTEFYTFALPEGEFRSYRLMSPDRQSDLWAYVPRDQELDQKLMALFIPSQITGEVRTEAQVTLRMEPGPEEGLPNQWFIQNLTSLDWLDSSQE